MTSFALNNLWSYLQGLALSQSDREWLAAQLVAPIDEAELPRPYTIEELHEQIALSEQDLHNGRYRDIEELFKEWDDETPVDYAAEPPAEYSSQQA